jgi:hypothetical protein
MELLHDMGHVEAHFSARFAPNVPWAQKSVWTHPMVLLGAETQVEAPFDPFWR